MTDLLDAFIASHPDGATCEEVAAALGCTRQAVQQAESRALAALAQVPWLVQLARDDGHEMLAGRGMAAFSRAVARENERVMRALDEGHVDTESIGDAFGLDDAERAALGKRIARLLATGAVVANGGHPRTYRRAGR